MSLSRRFTSRPLLVARVKAVTIPTSEAMRVDAPAMPTETARELGRSGAATRNAAPFSVGRPTQGISPAQFAVRLSRAARSGLRRRVLVQSRTHFSWRVLL